MRSWSRFWRIGQNLCLSFPTVIHFEKLVPKNIEKSAVLPFEDVFFVGPSDNPAFCVKAVNIRVSDDLQKRKNLVPHVAKLISSHPELHPLWGFLTQSVSEQAIQKAPERPNITFLVSRPKLFSNFKIKTSPIS